MTTETQDQGSILYNKGSQAYIDRLGLFRMAFGVTSEPDVIKCFKSEVHIKENGQWKQVFPKV